MFPCNPQTLQSSSDKHISLSCGTKGIMQFTRIDPIDELFFLFTRGTRRGLLILSIYLD